MTIYDKFNGSNIFSKAEWALSWYESVSKDARFKPVVLDDKGEVLPLVFKRKKRPFPFNNFIEYPAQDIAYDIDISLTAETMQKIMRLKSWDVINLRHLKDSASLQDTVLNLPASSRHPYISVDDDAVWDIGLPDTFEKYLYLLKNEDRKKFIYYLNRFKKLDGFGFCLETDKFEGLWERFIKLHEERVKSKAGKTLLSAPIYGDFYKRFCKMHYDKGNLRFASIKVKERPVAMLLGIEAGGVFYYMNSGFAGNISKYSPGIVLPLLCIEYSIEKGLQKFSFLGGDEPYKRDLGANCHPTKKIMIFRNRTVMALESFFNRIFR